MRGWAAEDSAMEVSPPPAAASVEQGRVGRDQHAAACCSGMPASASLKSNEDLLTNSLSPRGARGTSGASSWMECSFILPSNAIVIKSCSSASLSSLPYHCGLHSMWRETASPLTREASIWGARQLTEVPPGHGSPASICWAALHP